MQISITVFFNDDTKKVFYGDEIRVVEGVLAVFKHPDRLNGVKIMVNGIPLTSIKYWHTVVDD